MTKDRRLGRGLAALLGTPVDENGAPLEDAVTNTTSTAVAEAKAPTARVSPTRKPSVPQDAKTPPQPPAAPETQSPSVARNATIETLATEARKEASNDSGQSSAVSSSSAMRIPVNLIENNPFQPRREFNEDEIASLAESLREHEQLQPILVRKVGTGYQLISGERRLRATKYAGLDTIRAEVREADDRLVAELAIIENLQRKDLNAIEKALSFRRYVDEHGCTQEDLAKRLKIDRSTVTNLMRLLELPEPILSAVQSDRISAGHARAMLPLESEEQQLEFASRCESEGWSVRQIEQNVKESIGDSTTKTNKKTGSPKAPKSEHIASLEQDLKMALGTKVDIKAGSRGSGKITIHFSNAVEFERLRDALSQQGSAK